MAGFAALAYAAERPARTRRFELFISLPGFPAAARRDLPGSGYLRLNPQGVLQ
jgi:hypothetical protein